MHDAVMRALCAFKAEREGNSPTSLKLHPEDWDRLRYEMGRNANFISVDPHAHYQKVFGMVVLLDHKWSKGMPLALDTSGAAEAIERGAFQA